MRYTPLGWSKTYEFSDAELRSGMDTIDQWLEIVGKGRANIAPEQIPWNAISTLLSQEKIMKYLTRSAFRLCSSGLKVHK